MLIGVGWLRAACQAFLNDILIPTRMSIALPHETGFFSHTDCRLHDMGGDHPESPARLDAIADRVLAKGLTGAMTFLDAPRKRLNSLPRARLTMQRPPFRLTRIPP
jgi:hypothetical protein